MVKQHLLQWSARWSNIDCSLPSDLPPDVSHGCPSQHNNHCIDRLKIQCANRMLSFSSGRSFYRIARLCLSHQPELCLGWSMLLLSRPRGFGKVPVSCFRTQRYTLGISTLGSSRVCWRLQDGSKACDPWRWPSSLATPPYNSNWLSQS